MIQNMAEWGISAAVVAEPYFVSPQPNWVGDTYGLVAVVVPPMGSHPPISKIRCGSGYVAVKWGKIVLIGVYFSPNRPLVAFELFLQELGRVVGGVAPAPVLLLGDLNAKSTAWGSPRTDPRGEALEDWAAGLGLEVLNQGAVNTCVRRQGGSIVDVTFATPAIATRMLGWRVLEDVETLSDHLYIRFGLRVSDAGRVQPLAAGRRGTFPKWALGSLDREAAKEAAMIEARWGRALDRTTGVEERALQFRGSLAVVCDRSMRRAGKPTAKKQVYWWSEEVAALRYACNRARRLYGHCRRRRHTPEEEELLHRALLEAKEALCTAIAKAKDVAHEEFLATLDSDPWGRPYKLVRGKMKNGPSMDSLEPELLSRVVEGLFPPAPDFVPPVMALPQIEEGPVEVVPVSEGELAWAVHRLRACKKAPGPDGVHGRILPLAMEELGNRLKDLFDDCLEAGRFPQCWKEGRLCLLRKESRPADSPSGWRPIVLLDETGKMLERILSSRIIKHLDDTGPNMSDRQYGFRVGRSCMDALGTLRGFHEEAAGRGQAVVAVSLDIANAFGSLPYSVIAEALRYHGVPLYLRRIVEHYLTERVVLYEDREGRRRERPMACGVPQGSVLGPLLWNLGYDWAIRGALLPRTAVICYADDTMVAVRGEMMREVMRRAEVAAELMVTRIRLLGLEVSLPKTDAIIFGGRGKEWRPPPGAALRVSGEMVQVRPHIKYLGLILDRRWKFGEHFRQLAPRVVGAASALGRLLPNVGGPSVACRRLYAGVARSMALYGAPIWADRLSVANRALLRRPQRVVAIRICRAYVTVAWAAACTLAGTSPWEHDAGALAEAHRERVRWRNTGEYPAPEEVREARRQTQRRVREKWKADLGDSLYGVRTIGAILGSMDSWLDRAHGKVGFRLAQVMTGHGCFGHYLCMIQREDSPTCHECGAEDDTAQHTLEWCPRWAEERRTMTTALGVDDLSLHSVVAAMLASERSWEVVASFCEVVISQKEAAEREREDSADALPLRRRRRGRGRRRFAAAGRVLPQ
jgi:hypothetical protein